MYAFLLLIQSDILRTLFCGVGFCAGQQSAAWLAKRLSTSPTKIAAQPQSQTAYLRLPNSSWLIIYLDRDVYARTRAPAAIFSSLLSIFGSGVFSRTVNVQFIRDIT